MSKFHTLSVIELQKECPDTTSITFEIPTASKEAFKFKAGQYLTIKLSINGEEIRRSYSMSSAPMSDQLTITVKEVKGGKASTYINSKLKVGDKMDVMPPEGRFTPTIDPDKGKSYYLFAGGSGITPIMSIIRTLLEEEPLSTLHLLYASRDEEHIIFKKQLEELAETYQDQLILDYLLSQPKKEKAKGLGGWFKKASSSWTGKSGRITSAIVQDFLNEHPIRGKNAEYYLCGPGGFMEVVDSSLLAQGIDKSQIHSEYFTTADLSKSNTAPSTGEVINAQLTYVIEKEEGQVQVPVGKTILETLLDAKVDAPFSCQSGACSTCMAKVESGSVVMDACLALDDDEVDSGYVLACQARPTSSEVKISFDV